MSELLINVPNDDFGSLRTPEMEKARTERGKDYPERFPVPEGLTWENVNDTNYNPPEYTAPKVYEMDSSKNPDDPTLWADPVDITKINRKLVSYEGEVLIGKDGYPLNPKGPTGLRGRGLLGRWGANFAADPVVTRINPEGKIELIIIIRSDSGEVALPGGMVDSGERVTETLRRELGEETSAQLDFEKATPVYQGYVDDPRNTDNAWIETDAYHLHLEGESDIELKAGSDATEVDTLVIDRDLLGNMYASHANTVRRAISLWQERTGLVVLQNGEVVTRQ